MLFCTCEPEEKGHCRKSCPSANGPANDARHAVQRFLEHAVHRRQAIRAGDTDLAALWKDLMEDHKTRVLFYLKHSGSFECRSFRAYASQFRKALRAQPLAA